MVSTSSFLSFQDAHESLIQDNQVCVDTHTIPLFQAHGRILAGNIIANTNVPSYDNSAMDGYAIRFSDFAQYSSFKLIGAAFAGHPFDGQWQPGSCIRIMTGAAIPWGYDTVIMQEHAEVNKVEQDTLASFTKTPTHAQNVRLCGEDIRLNETLFSKGHRLRAADIGILASLGIAELSVYKPLKVAILSTGDELYEPGSDRSQRGIFDTNRYTIHAVLQNLGFEVLDLGIIKDNPAALEQAFKQASSHADVVISSGGVSVGEADYTKSVLCSQGSMQFWKVAIKPGKPFAYGHFEHQNQSGYKKRFMGLPGNPVSSLVTLHQLALPALRKMAGETVQPLQPLRLPLAKAISKKPGRMEFIRATLSHGLTNTEVVPLKSQGSAVLSTFCNSTGYLLLDAEQSHWQAGELVSFLPFDTALQ